MEYKIEDIVDENGKLKRVPKGLSSIEIKGPDRIVLFNDDISILLVKIYKDIFAARISSKRRVFYKFIKSNEELPLDKDKVVKREDYLINALDKVINDVESYMETERSKETIFYLYLIRGCIKGDKSSCNELQDLLYFETVE